MSESANPESTLEKVVPVLLVDDDVRNLNALEIILGPAEYRLIRAQNAQDALLALLEIDFAAIILDVQMPDINGIELARLIKQRKRTQFVPLLFLTAHILDEKEVLKGYEAGAVDFLTKPVDPKILRTKIAIFADLFRKTQELEVLNASKANEIIRRQQAEELLQIANAELEIRIGERTEKLRHFAAIIESSADAIVSTDLNSAITSWNHAAQRLFGYEPAEVIGKSVMPLIPPERLNEEPQMLERIRRGERIDHYETIRQHKNGGLLDLSLTVSPIKDEGGRVIGASKIARDITAQKKAERELERAHKSLLAASRAKDNFLAALSHELRTPLNPVLLLASDAAQNPQLPAEIKNIFATIQRNVELEARLIDDLLDITRLSHGKITLAPAPQDIGEILREAVETVEAEFIQKQINLTMPQLPQDVICQGDSIRLKQVFWNILNNAAKFTPAGGTVALTVFVSEDQRRVVINISDSGIGLTPGEAGSIFDAFSQGEHAANKGGFQFGGLGLGLAISRKLVELHSGKIQARSDGRGKGSTFSVELPILKITAIGSIAKPPSLGLDSAAAYSKPKRILLVEDHEPTRLALAQLLERRRHTVVCATGMTQAVEIAGKTPIDLVISDIGLAEGDGYTLMAQLREKYGLKGIALTGYGMEQDVARSREAGFMCHLLKPVRIDALEAALKRSL